MSTLQVNQWLNPDGSENYKCRAWVNFNGTGTVAIRASGNVASIADNGVGDYTVNFTVPMLDANHAASVSATRGGGYAIPHLAAATSSTQRITLTQFNASVATPLDADNVAVAIFR